MKNKLLLKIVLVSLILFQGAVSAQENKKNIPPLYNYLQNNADSTIILTYQQDFLYPAVHFILSKQSGNVALYLYGSPYDRRGLDAIPRNIRGFFQKRDIEISRLKVDTNSYFNPKYVKPKKAVKLWRKTMSYQPWQISDDAIDGEGCAKSGNNDNDIYDGGSISLFLITKGNIKRLYFYAPAFYDKKCPKRNGRRSILAIERLFKAYFGKV
ncbi:hypothetical protein [Pedobacter boryungensis]|uniref:Uncharacterized protein n=1 Tax=Pedobacter boryungensis TaxID=869962 RepID=A0ABX2DBI9_9SPHI|nr:hypothetical protein [Pedobacter boryungensis]NQX31438.1 hypothetical protein [Pedobacter boryungensis]